MSDVALSDKKYAFYLITNLNKTIFTAAFREYGYCSFKENGLKTRVRT